MRYTDLTPAWQRAVLAGRAVFVKRIDQGDDDHQVWLADSTSDPAMQYGVTLFADADGLEIVCNCRAGMHGLPCKHAGRVLCEAGHARWWDTIVALRDRDGRASVWLDAAAPAEHGTYTECYVHVEDQANWGYGGSGPWWLAQRLAYLATGAGDPAVVQAIKEQIVEPAPWIGWRLRAVDLDRVVARATEQAVAHVH